MHSTPPPVLSIAVVASALAGLVHAAASGSHAEVATLPVLFAGAAVVQLGWAALAVRRPTATVAAIGIGIQTIAIAVLLVSRTVGISAVAALDNGSGLSSLALQEGATLVFEVVALVAAGVFLAERGRVRLPKALVPALMMAGIFAAVPAMAQPHDHSSHGHDDAAVAAGADGAGHDHGSDTGHDDTGHDDTGHDTAGHDEAGHDDDHGHDASASDGDTAADDSDPPYPASFVSWLDKAETPADRAAAEKLILETTEAMKAFPDEASLQAAGFVSIGDGATGWEHYIHVERILDPRSLDPDDIESVVLKVNPDGTKQVASAMYLLPFGTSMDDVPDVAGDLTVWHDHQNLCWDGVRVVGVTDADGNCPRGEFRPTQPMMHVWIIDHECGPFAGIEGAHGSGCADHGHDDSHDDDHDH